MAGLVFLLVSWVLAGACKRHGVGGFVVWLIIIVWENEKNAGRSNWPFFSFFFNGKKRSYTVCDLRLLFANSASLEVNFYAALALQTSATRAEHKSRTTHTHTHTHTKGHTAPRAHAAPSREQRRPTELLSDRHHHCSRRSRRRRSDIGALAHYDYPFLRGIRSGGTNFGTTGAGRGPRDRKVACEACVEAVEREHDERSPRRSLS